MPIKDIPIEQRPREKASLYGFDKLSDIELLAIFIRSGGKDSVLNVSFKLIARFGSLKQLSKAGIEELMKIKGIGKVKAIEIKALSEFANRISSQALIQTNIKDEKTAVSNCMKNFRELNREQFIILSLDRTNNVISWKQVYKGTESTVDVEPREIVSILIKEGANKFFCFHNHPSGDVTPSSADIFLTKRIENHATIFNIELLGHLVINKNGDYKKIDIS